MAHGLTELRPGLPAVFDQLDVRQAVQHLPHRIDYGTRSLIASRRNPELEVGRFLTEHAFAHSAPVAGSIEYTTGREAPRTLGILQGFLPNHGDMWEFTLHELGLFFEREIGRAHV